MGAVLQTGWGGAHSPPRTVSRRACSGGVMTPPTPAQISLANACLEGQGAAFGVEARQDSAGNTFPILVVAIPEESLQDILSMNGLVAPDPSATFRIMRTSDERIAYIFELRPFLP